MRFECIIDTHSEAMQSPEAVAEALRQVAAALRTEVARRADKSVVRRVRDINGNSCGSWTLEVD